MCSSIYMQHSSISSFMKYMWSITSITTFVILFIASIIGENIFNDLRLILVLLHAIGIVVGGCEVRTIDAFGMSDKLMKTKEC